MTEGKEKNNSVVNEKEQCMDIKRELEFEIIMLEEQNGRAQQRGEARLAD